MLKVADVKSLRWKGTCAFRVSIRCACATRKC